jgi:hypothetical protein
MKYIFMAGAPGSKWSSVAKNIYFSDSIDCTDSNDSRSYAHKDQYSGLPMHLGSYFDPGMEFDLPEDISQLTRRALEELFDAPFSGQGVRIIKSHIFSNHIDFLKKTWPKIPVVLVHRLDDACLGWWVRCGGFDISYPNYHPYYKNLDNMATQIARQNQGILTAWNLGTEVYNNVELALALGISTPPAEYRHNYFEDDIKVKVI